MLPNDETVEEVALPRKRAPLVAQVQDLLELAIGPMASQFDLCRMELRLTNSPGQEAIDLAMTATALANVHSRLEGERDLIPAVDDLPHEVGTAPPDPRQAAPVALPSCLIKTKRSERLLVSALCVGVQATSVVTALRKGWSDLITISHQVPLLSTLSLPSRKNIPMVWKCWIASL